MRVSKEKAAGNRDALLQAASRLFRQRGIDGVGVADIAREAGLTQKGRAEGFGGKVFQAENTTQRTAILDTLIAVAKDAGVTPSRARAASANIEKVRPTSRPEATAPPMSRALATTLTTMPPHAAPATAWAPMTQVS